MSIQDEIEAARRSGLLVPFSGLVPWAATPRVFLMSFRLAAQIAEGVAAGERSRSARWSALEADIAHFVEGGFVNWGLMK
ncbi:hypothetical protein [Roseicella sp. DB1501]|uniref:hypothetical protein n=1 Tax=Roseicella sp. DB1501 TaxID=2730925 RepID=UPI001492AB10|nr:hypothetical protein [Roseicella sp. DB1501]NOG72910.1 hypothetical protein [Roseicella sp. DB1501]